MGLFYAGRIVRVCPCRCRSPVAALLGQEPQFYLYLARKKFVGRAAQAVHPDGTASQPRRARAHIVGEREFWSLPFIVNESTLIPRPDTEILVETALNLPLSDDIAVLDLGTGTGAIALALAHERQGWQVTAVDKVEAAVELACANRDNLKLPQVEILQSDWFSAVQGRKFQLIVSNPPYIEEDDEHLEMGDVRFEPRSALTAADQLCRPVPYRSPCQGAPAAGRLSAAGAWLCSGRGPQGKTCRARLSAGGHSARLWLQ